MKEVGDIVRRSAFYNVVPPRVVPGLVTKITPKFAYVQWKFPDRPLLFYHGRRHKSTADLPPVTRVAHHNLELIERQGGPW